MATTTRKKEDNGLGIGVPTPKATCEDANCPFHGTVKVRGRRFQGTVVSSKAHLTATVEWERFARIPKYERYQRKRTKIHAHNPACIDAREGDRVVIYETRPLSKTKSFVIVQKMAKRE
ncbi:30S ribosomal protein S17 [Candidatus Woesearchaeota archaeon]|nr:30S ribosomal protein S17 [Candidatus Woesearchaeota archaeon]